MARRLLVPVIVLTTAGLLFAGCAAGLAIRQQKQTPAGAGQIGDATVSPAPSESATAWSAKPAGAKTTRATPRPTKTTSVEPVPDGPRIVYFRVAQKPKCAEGTAVFRSDPVPLRIEWMIIGATGGALSVDDPTDTPGTYGQVALQGSQEFLFSCGGAVGTTETHTYAIYTVGGGPQKSKTINVSVKVPDTGLGTTDNNG